jgi:hypothetical protein
MYTDNYMHYFMCLLSYIGWSGASNSIGGREVCEQGLSLVRPTTYANKTNVILGKV